MELARPRSETASKGRPAAMLSSPFQGDAAQPHRGSCFRAQAAL